MRLRMAGAILLTLLATTTAAAGTLGVFSIDRTLSVGTVRLSSDLAHRGALDLYVPLVDWGVRFNAVRLPVRLSLDLRTLDRGAVRKVARGENPDVEAVRHEAENAIGDYIRLLVVVVLLASLSIGLLVALALRGRAAPLRVTIPVAAAGALACALAVAFLLPPRGTIAAPEYYANGPDIPVALRAIDQAGGTAAAISEELNNQLIGLARLIEAPAGRERASSLSRLTLASDLHNNLLALPTLERAVRDEPLFFAGDLTSSGSPFEAQLTQRVARIGHPFVFVSGNHDSDVLERQLARAGAVVLTQRGRLLPSGRLGPVIVKIRGLRVAGYSDPFERHRANGFRARGKPDPTERQRRAFTRWVAPLIGLVDVVMVHAPSLTEPVIEALHRHPPRRPIAFLTGHTHIADLRTARNVVELNGGTAGGGGTGNLEKNQPFGLAVLSYRNSGRFDPLLADVVEIDAQSGAATAHRSRLDLSGPEHVIVDGRD